MINQIKKKKKTENPSINWMIFNVSRDTFYISQ